MYLFILESIGTQELILVGMVALIVFGPRKLPVMAKKAAKMLKEFRSISNDFRATWEKEISFDEVDNSKNIEKQTNSENFIGEGESFGQEIVKEKTFPRENSIMPEIKEVSKEDFEKLIESKKQINVEPTEKTVAEKSEWL